MANGRDNEHGGHDTIERSRPRETSRPANEHHTAEAHETAADADLTVDALDTAANDLVGSRTPLPGASAGAGLGGSVHGGGGSVASSAQARGDAGTDDVRRRSLEAAKAEAHRGLDRQRDGQSVVGIAGSDHDISGEDGALLTNLFGDNDAAQRFGRIHDTQAAMAEQQQGGLRFDVANTTSAAVGLVSTLIDDSDTGAQRANAVFNSFGYETDSADEIQGGVEAWRRARIPKDDTSK